MRIHCLQHASFEGPGAIAEWAARRGHELTGSHLYREGFPHPPETDMVVIMGGPMNIYQEREFPWLAEEKAYLRSQIDAGALVMGICLGAQLLADVLGGEVLKGEHREIGWFPVTLTTEGVRSGIFGSLPLRFDTLHWHSDTFTVPPNAVRTASSVATPNQAFEYDGGRVVAMQFHLEATPESWGELIDHAPGDLAAPGEWVSTAEAMLGKCALFTPANEMLFGVLDRMAALRTRR